MSAGKDKLRRTYAHLQVYDLGASVEARERGGRSVALYDEGGQRVVSVSPEARRRGVSPGMSRWEAERLCPELIAAEPDPEKYEYFRQQVLEICGDYSPRVKVNGTAGVDTPALQKQMAGGKLLPNNGDISIDLTGTELLFGPAKEIGQEIRNRLRVEIGVLASVGIGPNRTVARLACESAKPGEVVEVTPEEAQAFVGRLPIYALPGVDVDWAQRLHDMGIRRAKELAALPPEAVERALGEWGRRLWEIAQGGEPEDDRSGQGAGQETSCPTGIIAAQAEVRPATEDRARVRAAFRTAADEVGRRLRQQGQVARQIGIAVVFSDMRVAGARRTLGQATRSEEVIFRAAGALFDRMKLGGRMVRRVRITVGRLSAGPRGGQLGLPIVEQDQRRERLAERMNQVKDRFGEAAVARGSAMNLAIR